MRVLGKPRVLEVTMAARFIVHVFEHVEESWPTISQDWRPLLGDDASALDDQSVIFEVALAVVAAHAQALQGLLPVDQAARVRSHIVKGLCSGDVGTYPAQAMDEYQSAWDRSLGVPAPHCGIASILLDKLCGSGAASVGKASGRSSATLRQVGSALVALGGVSWKATLTQYGVNRRRGGRQ
jgi:hypothetical protein